MSGASYENILQEELDQRFGFGFLPPLWRLLYSEAIKGNHLIFSEQDVATFSQAEMAQTETGSDLLEEGNRTWKGVEEKFFQILGLATCSEMQQAISHCTEVEKKRVFKVYLRLIAWVSKQIRTQAN